MNIPIVTPNSIYNEGYDNCLKDFTKQISYSLSKNDNNTYEGLLKFVNDLLIYTSLITLNLKED